jgi:hypothetical protein
VDAERHEPAVACPVTPPPEGEACSTGGMGGVWEHCGYRCKLGDPASPWTVATCSVPQGQGYWIYDDACDG